MNKFLVAAAIAASLQLAGCGGHNADTALGAAKRHLAAKDGAAAVVELKNALQAKPDLAEARFLLGKTLLEREDPVGALVELRKAEELKYPAEELAPLLAKAYVATGDGKKAIDLDRSTVLAAAPARAEMKTQVALAYLQDGDVDRASNAVAQALQAAPGHAPALLLRARLLAGKGDLQAATTVVDSLLSRAPNDADAHVLKGQLLRAGNDVTGAIEAWRKALSIKPDLMAAHSAVITELLGKNDLEGAAKQIAELKRVKPTHLQTQYFEARLAFQKGDLKAADEQVQRLLTAAPESPMLLRLAAATALRRQDGLQAEKHLRQLVQIAPQAAPPRLSLARIYLASKEADKVVEVLQPLVDAPQPDPMALSLMGRAQLLLGDTRRAEELLAKAAKLAPNDASNRTSLAVAHLVGGDKAAYDELESIATADSAGSSADMVLILSHVNAGRLDAALKAVDRLTAKMPDKPEPLFVRGRILTMRKDLAGARAAFEQALKLDGNFFPAVQALVALDVAEKKPDQARARLEAVLKRDPKHPAAAVGIALLDESQGKPRDAIAAQLAKAVADNPTNLGLRRQLVNFQLRSRNPKAALAAAQDAATASSNSPEALALLGQAQLAAGEGNQAIATYGKLAALQPKSVGALLTLADAQIGQKAYNEADETMKRAVALAPDLEAVQMRAATVEVLRGRHNDAIDRAHALQTRLPKSGLGFLMEADVEASRKNWKAAATAYEAALARTSSSVTARRLHAVLLEGGERARAQTAAAEWLKAHPTDQDYRLYLATRSIADGEFAAAESQFRTVLAAQPDRADAINNLAWVLWRQKKPGALELAERANTLAPNQAAILDTLALIVADQGNLPRAIELQRNALALDPAGHLMRLQLARMLVKAGDKPGARKELDALAALGDKLPQQAEVKKLQAEL